MTPQTIAQNIGFALPQDYNAARLLWDNDPARLAILHDAGRWTYGDLQAEAARIGNALLAAGSVPGDRVLLYLEDHPVYPAAIMGAMRAGLVAMLINTLSTQELMQAPAPGRTRPRSCQNIQASAQIWRSGCIHPALPANPRASCTNMRMRPILPIPMPVMC